VIRGWATNKVDWRGPASLWVGLAWILAVLWPPLPLTLIFWPSNNTGIDTVRDLRAIALIVGAAMVTIIFMLIDRERKREGAPRTRLGVILRFVAYGFVMTVLVTALAAAALAVIGMTSSGDVLHGVGEAKATLGMGIFIMPLALLIGVSYALWSGLVTSAIAFGPRPPSVRPRHYLMDTLAAEAPKPEPVTLYAAEAPPPPPPAPTGPHPETEIEAALRPDLD
jgi:hypothetical protein